MRCNTKRATMQALAASHASYSMMAQSRSRTRDLSTAPKTCWPGPTEDMDRLSCPAITRTWAAQGAMWCTAEQPFHELRSCTTACADDNRESCPYHRKITSSWPLPTRQRQPEQDSLPAPLLLLLSYPIAMQIAASPNRCVPCQKTREPRRLRSRSHVAPSRIQKRNQRYPSSSIHTKFNLLQKVNLYFLYFQPPKKTEASKIPSPRPLADILDKTRGAGASKIPQVRRRNSRGEEGKFCFRFLHRSRCSCLSHPRRRRNPKLHLASINIHILCSSSYAWFIKFWHLLLRPAPPRFHFPFAYINPII